MNEKATYDVVGIGYAFVDIIASVDDSFLKAENLVSGSMQKITPDRAKHLYSLMLNAVKIPRGSAANTAVGVSSAGGKAAYIGKVANDELGRIFTKSLIDAGVDYATQIIPAGNLTTGHCLVLVTPDGERTLNTYPGVSGLFEDADLNEKVIGSAKIVYLEGYRFDVLSTQETFYRAVELAHAAGSKIALSLSARFCVETHRENVRKLIADHVDILFANEAEITALYETSFNDACCTVAKDTEITCLTRGSRGSAIVANGKVISLAAEPARQIVDTNGAGDLYAAGFLYGLTRGKDLQHCGRIAGIAAAEAISHIGARPRVKLSELLETTVA